MVVVVVVVVVSLKLELVTATGVCQLNSISCVTFQYYVTSVFKFMQK